MVVRLPDALKGAMPAAAALMDPTPFGGRALWAARTMPA
jgi:hypothetical protein